MTIAAIAVFVIIAIFLLRGPIGRGLSAFAHAVASPIFSAKKGIGESFHNTALRFTAKSTLDAENEALKKAVTELQFKNLERDILFNENIQLKEALGRMQNPQAFILGVVLSKPPASPYDTVIIDIGANDQVRDGALVFAYGNIPIGTIAEVYAKTALVKLFSTGGELTKVVVGNTNLQLDAIGTGGGNFTVTLPREIAVTEGSTFSLPNSAPQILAVVRKVVTDSRDPFQKIIATSPVHVSELTFVEVER